MSKSERVRKRTKLKRRVQFVWNGEVYVNWTCPLCRDIPTALSVLSLSFTASSFEIKANGKMVKSKKQAISFESIQSHKN